ncbi:HPr family phosphocarrier protein [Teredinibacter purpureus]|jgi:Phosphotransferase System HPr (HPr) Family|uniref:HPr family phosphocarrier protein n=1 Tax=Teredinibacter purpureus TaxID=2731756 RepID=UPI0005F77DF1|nr:HPr family phosphocarrier protein [Teredinibacter purpureus]
MQEKHLQIINKLGLHARAATKLANIANRFSARTEVTANGKSTDAKSIMSLMLLAASKGTEIQLRTEGEDEEAAMAAVTNLINNRFDEAE